MFVAGHGPNSFILGTLPGAVAAYFVVPISFYAFNKKLRNDVPEIIKVLVFAPKVVLSVYDFQKESMKIDESE